MLEAPATNSASRSRTTGPTSTTGASSPSGSGRWATSRPAGAGSCARSSSPETRQLIGHVGFHGPPGINSLRAPDAVEVGYTIFPEHRRNGYASEAVEALLEWARAQGIHRFVASVGPENEPSLKIVRRLGFVEVGRHWDDEDGEELEFELRPSG